MKPIEDHLKNLYSKTERISNCYGHDTLNFMARIIYEMMKFEEDNIIKTIEEKIEYKNSLKGVK